MTDRYDASRRLQERAVYSMAARVNSGIRKCSSVFFQNPNVARSPGPTFSR